MARTVSDEHRAARHGRLQERKRLRDVQSSARYYGCMTEPNPYESPKAPIHMPPVGEPVAPCPACQNTRATKVHFTWWGGALGPKLFNVVKCTQCRTRFNGKTGGWLTNAIIVYQVVAFAIVLVVVFLLFAANR